jgi:hypothetical protein
MAKKVRDIIEFVEVEDTEDRPEIEAALDWLTAWSCITDGAGKHSGHCHICREAP